MTRTQRLLPALLVGVALATALEVLFGYAAALPMPWLLMVGKHIATIFSALFTLCVGLVPAYAIGRVLFRYVGSTLPQVLACALPWVVWSVYIDYVSIAALRTSLLGFNSAVSSWFFFPGITASLLSVPIGLWLASGTKHGIKVNVL
jgi:hypothetical protein